MSSVLNLAPYVAIGSGVAFHVAKDFNDGIARQKMKKEVLERTKKFQERKLRVVK